MKERLRNSKERGITLIALVITIVILIILATVAINALFGENGLITQTHIARTQIEISKEKEEIAIAYNGAKAENNGKKIIGEDLNNQFDLNGTKAKARGSNKIIVKFTESGRIYEINENGEIGDSTQEWVDYTISATMSQLYKYYVEGNTTNGYQLRNDGTDCISVESKEELKYLSEYTNLNNQTENITFVIINNINLNEKITFKNDGTIIGGIPEKWEPIAKVDSTNVVSFKGKIDGQGYSISGMYIDGEYSGLIGITDGAMIQNLNLCNSYMLAGENSGILVAQSIGDGINIKNVESNDNYILLKGDNVGGILGIAKEGNANLENIYSKNTMVFEKDYFGFGIAGILGRTNGKDVNVINCSNYTEIDSFLTDSDYSEGIAGIIGGCFAENIFIDNCINSANISGGWGGQGGILGQSINTNVKINNCYNTGDIGGNWATGGIAGYEASDRLEITNSYNTGKIYHTDYSGGETGGIIGQCLADLLTMYNTFNAGEIYTSEENYTYGHIGGLVGTSCDVELYNCYNIGKINMYIYGEDNVNSGINGIGGLFGLVGLSNVKISNCYNSCEVILNYPSNKNVEASIYFGNLIGELEARDTNSIENCYGFVKKNINLPQNACIFAQNIGIYSIKPEDYNILNLYIDKNNQDPSIAYQEDDINQNIQEIESYQSKEFCNILNEWVNNNSEEKYAEWKYDINKNNGLPYFEF